MSLKKEIEKILAETNSDVEFENRVVKLFELNREQFFKAAAQIKTDPDNYALMLSCSCGSREDSCEEDGEGNYSKFFIDRNANIFRMVQMK